MPFTAEHKQQSRQRILASAARLFCQSGFDGVTLGAIMKHAKLTHGAFYAHFKSKSDLYQQALKYAVSESFWGKYAYGKLVE